MPLLTNEQWRKQLARCLDSATEGERIELVAFVFMPEHLHLLIHPRNVNPSIGRFLARVKQPFSRQVKDSLAASGSPLLHRLTVQERPGKTCFRFWQEGPGFDRNLFSPAAIAASLDYIHQNPVRRGLCKRAVDWKWSSARYYLSDPPRQQESDLPFIHGLPVGVFG